jgi:hypothetical protein
MFVRSTGLGRTLLTAKVARIVATDIVPSTLEPPPNGTKEPTRLLMELEITHPVHWTVRAFVDPPDLRMMIKHVLTHPGLILQGIKFLFSKGPKYDVQVAQAEAPKTATPGPAGSAKAATATAGTAPKGPPPIPSRK